MATKDIRNPGDPRPWPGEVKAAVLPPKPTVTHVMAVPPPTEPTVIRPPIRKPLSRPSIDNEAMAERIKRMKPEEFVRRKEKPTKEPPKEPPPVTLGAVDKGMDLAFNPTREKLREVTIVDRMQGKLFPLLDMVITGRDHILKVAMYRQDPIEYERIFEEKRPVTPNLLEEFLYRTAQWQKSVQGTNLTKITDIALAEVEGKAGDDEGLGKDDPWNSSNKD